MHLKTRDHNCEKKYSENYVCGICSVNLGYRSPNHDEYFWAPEQSFSKRFSDTKSKSDAI